MNRRVAANGLDARIAAWWDAVLAGDVDASHPLFGDQLKVRLDRGRLILSGEIDGRHDRDELVRQARSRIGNGVQKVESSALKVRPKRERAGVLEQTLTAAFDRRETAELAATYLREHSHVTPREMSVVDKATDLEGAVPEEVLDAAAKQLERGQALLVVKVDETRAYRIRSLLEEDTRSHWTVAAPPRVITNGHENR